ncbi:HAD family hydrolase [Haloglomus litoreum]|uniref:HAD family hydrolase n=1 Tax=Haloglomus litoreum TaxID=3034026 RepID=UPI0023E892BB|nr:HAD family hydrolase [Haloglomus sp. DT116]
MLQAVGFDLDGTLLVAERDRESLLHAACERVGAPRLDREAYVRAHRQQQGGADREVVFATLLADHETDVDAAALAAAYDAVVEAATGPLPGAAALVDRLRERYAVGLLTDGPVGTQRRKLERVGWADLFDAVVVTGGLDAPKPDERAFEALCEALDVPPGATAYVGDNPEADIAGAAAAGLHPVQVLYEGGPAPHPDAAATVERAALAEALPALLAGLEDS